MIKVTRVEIEEDIGETEGAITSASAEVDVIAGEEKQIADGEAGQENHSERGK